MKQEEKDSDNERETPLASSIEHATLTCFCGCWHNPTGLIFNRSWPLRTQLPTSNLLLPVSPSGCFQLTSHFPSLPHYHHQPTHRCRILWSWQLVLRFGQLTGDLDSMIFFCFFLLYVILAFGKLKCNQLQLNVSYEFEFHLIWDDSICFSISSLLIVLSNVMTIEDKPSQLHR